MKNGFTQALQHVYWIGGSPCSGKTSIARELVNRYNLTYYDCDQAFYQHNQRVTPEEQPVFYRVMRLSAEALWMRPADQLVADELAIYREEFPLILEDLLALPRSRPILAEGAALLPECVAPLLTHARQAIWVIPSAEFQIHHYSRREWAKDVVQDTSNPQQAFQNWMQRDIQFARFVHKDAEQRGLRVLVVDGAQSLQENIQWVESHFQYREISGHALPGSE